MTAFGGDGGAVYVYAALHASAGHVCELPCDGCGEEHVGAVCDCGGPHAVSHHVIYVE